jgi:drug/metabolite transporter (DMT)-like permease
MLAATLLALAAAVLHAGWNLWVKQSEDRWIALWGQMTCAGIMCAILLVALGGAHNIAWWPLAASATIHSFYAIFLARAYNLGDFSVAYPIARGTGALLAAVGGILFLSDHLSVLMFVGIGIAVLGILLLAGPADNKHVVAALMVSLTIGAYSVIDSYGSRHMGGNLYPLLLFIGAGITMSTYGLATGRRHDMALALTSTWKRFCIAGIASVTTYWMVLIAVQKAPVGYVTALRESSVVIVALVGTRYLGEKDMKRRVFAACIVVAGLGVLIAGR